MKSGVYITCGLLLLSGCVQGNWRQSLVRSFSRDGAQTASSKRVQMVEKLLDEAPVPPRATVPLLRAQNPDNPGVALTSGSASKTTLISHDATTLALIDKETKDFAPADRERAITALKAIPSESIPAVLQLWKAGLISPLAHPSSPVILAPSTAADLPSRPTLASQTTTTADAGLGQKSPWPADGVQLANYSPPDWNQTGTVSATNARSQEITRVNTVAMGYSSPLPDNSQRLGLMEAAERFDQARTGSSTTQRGNGVRQFSYKTTSSDSSVTDSRSTPPDWQTAPRNVSASTTPGGRVSNSFASDSGRSLITPPEWQTNITSQPSRPSVRSESVAPAVSAPNQVSPRSSFKSNPPMAQAAPSAVTEKPREPLIRPQAPTAAAESPAAKSTIQRMGFSEAVAAKGSPFETALVPGQTLPGFEEAVTRAPQMSQQGSRPTEPPFQSSEHRRDVIHGSFRSDQNDANWSMPPAAPRMTSTNDALKALIRATEAEVDQLVPGQTATELQYYIERQVYLRLLYIMSGQTEWALRPIPNIPSADQEFWTQVLWGVHNYFDLPQIPNHAERAAQTIAQFNTAMLRLKERAPLELKNVTFCHKIDGYGEYDTYPKDEFTPGQRVLVYAEVGNFHSELSAEGIYRTRLKSTLQIISAEAPQEPIDVKVYPVTEDYCRNHRRDYFHSYVVEIPVRCVRGSHTLKLIIEDEQSGKAATYPVSFVVR